MAGIGGERSLHTLTGKPKRWSPAWLHAPFCPSHDSAQAQPCQQSTEVQRLTGAASAVPDNLSVQLAEGRKLGPVQEVGVCDPRAVHAWAGWGRMKAAGGCTASRAMKHTALSGGGTSVTVADSI